MSFGATFQPFSITHGLIVTVFLLMTIGVVAARRRIHHGQKFDRALAVITGAAWVVINGWGFMPGKYNLLVSLPLHACDLVALLVPFVLVRPRRWMRAVLYFWGLGMSSHGFLTPDLQDGPARSGFWFFWANHYIVVGAAIYDLAARGFGPGWRDYGTAALAGAIYLAVVIPLDVAFNLNYGYVGPSDPNQPTIIDHLGPWPGRVVVMMVLTAILMALMVLPWTLARTRHKSA